MTPKATAKRPIIVVKYGGNAIEDERSLPIFAQSVAAVINMGYYMVIVHGGGPQINHWLDQTGTTSHFVDGQRYTDASTLTIVEMALCAQVNKAIVRACDKLRLNAVGISGQDGKLLLAEPNPTLGLVGQVKHVNTHLITHLLAGGYLPVIAPLGLDANQQPLNINADFSAANIAGALGAEQFILMTNVDGILDANHQRLSQVNQHDINTLIAEGVIHGGMLPKIACAQTALKANCQQVSIINGIDPANLLTVFNKPGHIGTQIRM